MKARRALTAAIGTFAVLSAPSAAHADTLRDALISTYNTNPTLQGARAQQRATDEDVPINRARSLPDVSVNGNLI